MIINALAGINIGMTVLFSLRMAHNDWRLDLWTALLAYTVALLNVVLLLLCLLGVP